MTAKHYQKHYHVILTENDKANGHVEILLDPYRIADIYQVGGGAREQILKKALRYTDKGHSEEEVLREIISAAERRLEMLREDEGPVYVAPPVKGVKPCY